MERLDADGDALRRLALWLREDEDEHEIDICFVGSGFSVDANNPSRGIYVRLEGPTLAEAIHAALDCYRVRFADEVN